jgi:S1-C subfamily serine protease
MAAAETSVNVPSWRKGWTPAWIAAFAAAAAAILVLLVVLIYREWRADSGSAQGPALEEQRSRNMELERQIAALQAEPLPDCSTESLSSAGADDPRSAAAARTPAPSASASIAPEANGDNSRAEGVALSTRELVALLNEATALVLSEDGSASGFFVAPDLLVTNRHAVEGSDGMVYVTSKSLGRVHRGRVVAASASGTQGAADFALVRVDGAPARRTLGFSAVIEPLMPVVAAGYPGLTIIHDAGFRALLGGDITAAPELVLNRGEVQALQRSPQGLTVIAHSGRILQGNSGGPLVDGCGRLVGINTYIAVDAAQAGQVSYAISAEELARFAATHGERIALAQSDCEG